MDLELLRDEFDELAAMESVRLGALDGGLCASDFHFADADTSITGEHACTRTRES